LAILVLKPGREKSVLRMHPWIFSGAVDRVDGRSAPGATVEVRTASGTWVGRASYNEKSLISARMWTWTQAEEVNEALFAARIDKARQFRRDLLLNGPQRDRTNALRLVFAESDGLPGLIVDGYAEFLVVQFLTAGAEMWKPVIANVLAKTIPAAGIYERSDVEVREKEGLAKSTGLLWGKDPPALVQIWERLDSAEVMRFLVDVKQGHKTGFYLDQRDGRKAVAAVAAGRTVLNAYSYTGAFAVAAYAGGAKHVVNVDTSEPARRLARLNLELNNRTVVEGEVVDADVPIYLRQQLQAGKRYDMIILDPPKFSRSRAQIDRAAAGYKDINLHAIKLLNPGGYLLTFSCSGLVSEDLFQKILFGASQDAGRDLQILRRLSQPPDHPVLLSYPEAQYLKGFVCRVV
jgi:23S rRNA (cytosine1962-C5)-methyltransferase